MLCRIETSKKSAVTNLDCKVLLESESVGARKMSHKKIPRRTTRIAEDYAKKVRMEPPKATRQEPPLVSKGKITARQHNPDKKVSPRRSPF